MQAEPEHDIASDGTNSMTATILLGLVLTIILLVLFAIISAI
jgi:hypothetical protein